MKFNYKAITKDGSTKKGTLEAKDKFALSRQLKSDGLVLVSAEESKESSSSALIASINAFMSKVKMQEKFIFARNLSSMLEAGLPLARSLAILERQTKNAKFKKIIQGIIKNVEQGSSLNESLKKYPKVFPQLFSAMVKAGEESGSLVQSLRVVADQMEKSYVIKKKIKGALLYPGIIISVMILVGVLMLMFVVPTLTSTFKELDVELPASTQAIVTISDFLLNNKLLLLPGLLAIIGSLSVFFKTKRGKRILDFTFIHVPIIGLLVKKTNSAYTTRTLSSLLSAGVDIVEALEITKEVIQNSYYKDVIGIAHEKIQKGATLSSTFVEADNLYPILVGEIMEVGEETGKVSDMILEVAVFYEKEVDAATKNMTTIIEPFLMVFVGAVVGFFAIAMISPTYSLMEGV